VRTVAFSQELVGDGLVCQRSLVVGLVAFRLKNKARGIRAPVLPLHCIGSERTPPETLAGREPIPGALLEAIEQ
jgi:hypothetical protein